MLNIHMQCDVEQVIGNTQKLDVLTDGAGLQLMFECITFGKTEKSKVKVFLTEISTLCYVSSLQSVYAVQKGKGSKEEGGWGGRGSGTKRAGEYAV